MERIQTALMQLDPSWVLWVLLALLFLAVLVGVERGLYFVAVGGSGEQLHHELDRLLSARDLSGARALLEQGTP